MRYNFMTVCNEGFMDYMKIFLNSLFTNVPSQSVGTVFIGDVGLSNESIQFLNAYPRVKILKTNLNANFEGVHGAAWQECVSQKTRVLHGLISAEQLPLIFVDADSCFLSDFTHLLTPEADLQICRCKDAYLRRDGILLRYIASFLYVGSNSVKEFVEQWMQEIMLMRRSGVMPAFETPSMCRVLQRYERSLHIEEIDEEQVSCSSRFNPERTHILHFRSNGGKYSDARSDFLYRLKSLDGYPIESVMRYHEMQPSQFSAY